MSEQDTTNPVTIDGTFIEPVLEFTLDHHKDHQVFELRKVIAKVIHRLPSLECEFCRRPLPQGFSIGIDPNALENINLDSTGSQNSDTTTGLLVSDQTTTLANANASTIDPQINSATVRSRQSFRDEANTIFRNTYSQLTTEHKTLLTHPVIYDAVKSRLTGCVAEFGFEYENYRPRSVAVNPKVVGPEDVICDAGTIEVSIQPRVLQALDGSLEYSLYVHPHLPETYLEDI